MTKIKLDIDTDENLSEVKIILNTSKTSKDNSVAVSHFDTEVTPSLPKIERKTHTGFDSNMMDIVNS